MKPILKIKDENGAWVGVPAIKGKDGDSVTVASVTESTESGGENVVEFSDGKKVVVKNGKDGAPGKDGVDGKDYILTGTDKAEIANRAVEIIDEALLDSIGSGANYAVLLDTIGNGVTE